MSEGEKMKHESSSWQELMVAKLSQYMSLKARADFLQEELAEQTIKLTVGYSLTPGSKGISDKVGNMAQFKMDREAELAACRQEIRSIERAINMLSPAEQLLIRTKYLEGNKDVYTWRILSVYGQKHQLRLSSRDTYYRLKEGALLKLAGILGLTEFNFQTGYRQNSDIKHNAKVNIL